MPNCDVTIGLAKIATIMQSPKVTKNKKFAVLENKNYTIAILHG